MGCTLSRGYWIKSYNLANELQDVYSSTEQHLNELDHEAAPSAATAGQIETPPVQNNILGVKLSYFFQFVKENGGESAFLNKNTKAVYEEFMLNKHQSDSNCLQQSECQRMLSKNCTGSLSFSWIGRPSWYICHSWSYFFLDTLNAVKFKLESIYGVDNANDVIVWFDLFSLAHQHQTDTDSTCTTNDLFLSSSLPNIMRNIDNMLVVLLPWDNESVLTNISFLFEIYNSIHSYGRLEVAFSSMEFERFKQSVDRDPTVFFKVLKCINSQKSQHLSGLDRNIAQIIREKLPGGFVELNKTVYAKLEIWTMGYLQNQIDYLSTSTESKVSSTLLSLAKMFADAGKSKEALTVLQESVNIRKQFLGVNHMDTFTSMNNLANIYYSMGNYVEAEQLYVLCLDGRRSSLVLGNNHPHTLTSMTSLGALYYSQKKYEKAESLLIESWESCRRILGDEHADTLNCTNNLANLYAVQGRHNEASHLGSECLRRCKLVLGTDHCSTVTCANNLATFYQDQGDYKNAEDLYRFCFDVQCRMLGIDNVGTLSAMNNLATLKHITQNFDESEELFVSCLASCKRVLGEFHPYTQLTAGSLKNLISERQNKEQCRQ